MRLLADKPASMSGDGDGFSAPTLQTVYTATATTTPIMMTMILYFLLHFTFQQFKSATEKENIYIFFLIVVI